MTVKTEILLLKAEVNITRSDMPRRGAVRKLFDCSPDRNELQRQVQQQNDEQTKKLEGYKCDGIISYIDYPQDQAKRLKRESSVQSESTDDEGSSSPTRQTEVRSCCDGAPQQISSPTTLHPSSSNNITEAISTSSDNNSKTKIVGSPIAALPRTQERGQRSIKSYFPVIKKKQT